MTEADSPLLRVQDLTKSYPLGGHRSLPVLQGLNLTIADGQMVAIMGPSGSGKTTLLNCLSGIDGHDSGTVLLDGRTLDLASEAARTRLRRSHVGIVFQFFNLVPTLSVRENVALPLLIAGRRPNPDDTRRIERLLHQVGMDRRADHLPFQLSGGEMQLASIARALVHRPRLVLADEPTGNVNPQVGRRIMAILRDTAKEQGAGVLMVTHSPEHAAWADQVCFLKEGVIADTLAQQGQHDRLTPIHAKLVELEI